MAAAGKAEMALDVAEQDEIQHGIAEAIERRRRPALPPVRQFAAPGQAGLDEALTELAALAEPEQESLLQFLVDAGHADEKRRCNLSDVERDGVDRLRKTDGAAEHELRDFAVAAFGDVTQGQV